MSDYQKKIKQVYRYVSCFYSVFYIMMEWQLMTTPNPCPTCNEPQCFHVFPIKDEFSHPQQTLFRTCHDLPKSCQSLSMLFIVHHDIMLVFNGPGFQIWWPPFVHCTLPLSLALRTSPQTQSPWDGAWRITCCPACQVGILILLLNFLFCAPCVQRYKML